MNSQYIQNEKQEFTKFDVFVYVLLNFKTSKVFIYNH